MLRSVNSMLVNPTATVLVNGLSVFCHKNDSSTMDFGFLKVFNENDHPFRLRVFKNDDIFWSSDFYSKDYFQDSTITITKTNTAGVFGYEHSGGMGGDDRDVRWMFDLAAEIYGVDRLPIRYPQRLFTKVTIGDGTFYTKLRSSNPAYISEINGTGTLPQRHVGRVLGADILCQSGEQININITWTGSTNRIRVPLPIFAGKYWIALDYKCIPDGVDDLPLIYNVIDTPTSQKYTIGFDPPETDWTYRGTIGNTASKMYVDECDFAEYQVDFPVEYRIYFNSAKEAEAAGYTPVVVRATEFACQTIGIGTC